MIKHSILFIIFLRAYTLSVSQPIYFEKLYDFQTRGEQLSTVLVDDSVIVVGGSSSSNSSDIIGLFIATDMHGNSQIEKLIDPKEYFRIEIRDIICSRNSFYFSGTGFPKSSIKAQPLFGKLTMTGDTIFMKSYGTPGISDISREITVINSNRFIITGTKVYPDSLQGQAKLTCVDSSGNLIWQTEYGNNSWENGSSTVITMDGGLLTVGTRDYNSSIDRDILLVKFDSLGHAQWEKTYGGNQMDGAEWMIPCYNGGYLICGYYNVHYDNVPEASIYKGWVLKIDSIGNIIWQKKIGNTGLFRGGFHNILQVKDSSYWLVGGYAEGYSKDKGWLVHISKDGNFLNEITIVHNPAYYNYTWDLDMAPNGDLVICGWTYNNDSTYYDAWLLRVDSNGCQTPHCMPVYAPAPAEDSLLLYQNPTGLSVTEKEKNGLSIYPNPGSGIIQISLPALRGEATFRLYNALGQAVLEQQIPAGTKRLNLDLSTLPRGWYVLRLQSNERVYSAKLILE